MDNSNDQIRLFSKVLLAQAGDRPALNEILIYFQRPLYRYFYRLLGNSQDAEECLQQLFFQIFRKIQTLKDPKLIKPWVYRIATRISYGQMKSANSQHEHDYEGIDSYPIISFEQSILSKIDIKNHLEKIDFKAREVLTLYYLQDLKLSEIAEILAIPIGTVKSRIFQGAKKLKASLER